MIHRSHFFTLFNIIVVLATITNVIFNPPRLPTLYGQTITFTAIIAEDPEMTESKISLRLKNIVLENGKSLPRNTQFFATFGTHEKSMQRSDKITLKGKLDEGFGAFVGSLFRPQIIAIAKPDPPDLALKLRDTFSEKVKEHLPAPEVDLALGYLTGQRRSLPEDLSDTLQIIGLTHIVVASGYNLSVLVRASRKLFAKISRFAAFFAAGVLIIIMISITGLTPSMLRAGLVAFISLIAWYFGRQTHPAKLLLAVMSATLIINPYYLLDIGYLLSFASFAGIMIFAPLLTGYFYADKEPNFLAKTFIETLSAQTLCLPILLYQFGSISLISVIPNLLILPTIPITMLATFISAFIPPVAFIAKLILDYHLLVMDFFGTLPFFQFDLAPENLPLAIILYIIILATIIYLQKSTKLQLQKTNLVV